MKILILGASGLLGGTLYRRLSEKHHVFGTFFNSSPPTLGWFIWRDLTFYNSVKNLLLKQNPDLVINCAANTNIDYCEKNRRESSRINMDMPIMLGNLWDKKLIHISSPAVFSGAKDSPYIEGDDTRPVNQYGFQKQKAEEYLRGKAIVFRADFYDRLAGYIAGNLSKGKRIKGFTDISFSPISASNYARIIEMAIENNLTDGVYHAGGAEIYTKYGFALALAKQIGLDCSLVSARKSNFDATRPKNTSLNSEKLENALGIKTPKLFEEL